MLSIREIAILVHNVRREFAKTAGWPKLLKWSKITSHEQHELLKLVANVYAGNNDDSDELVFPNPIQEAQHKITVAVILHMKPLLNKETI